MQLKMYRGKWAAVWYEGGSVKRHSLGTADRQSAEVEFDRFRRRRLSQVASVAKALQTYCQDKGFLNHHPTAYAADAIAKVWGSYGLDDISRELCGAYIEMRRAQKKKDGTIIKELGVCRAALNHVKPKNGSVFKLPPAPEPRDLRLTRQEFDRLKAAAGSDHLRLYLELAAATGARNGAILELTWKQLDFIHGLIDLGAGRGNKSRAVVPMTTGVRIELAKHRTKAERDPDGFVVTFDGRRVKSVKKAFGRAAAKAGLPWATPHVIRHSVACWLAEGGIPMPEIAAYLGHKDSRITERVYAKYSPTYLRRAAAVLEQVVLPVQIEQTPVPGVPGTPSHPQDIAVEPR